MKIPEKVPPLPNDPTKLTQAFSLFSSGKLKDVILKANWEYLYWDKFKYQKVPKGVDIKDAWYCLKVFNRFPALKPIGLKDRKGNSFSFWNTDRFLQHLSYIDKYAAGKILSPELPSPKAKEQYLTNSLMEESIASSMLEGAVSTRRAAKKMLRTGRPARNHSEKMIVNNYRTVRMIKELSGKPLSVALLNQLHASMTEDTLENQFDSGKIRSIGDEVDVVDEKGNLLHSGIPAEHLPKHLDQLCKFANQKEEDIYIHPVIKAIMLHFGLAYIHPYMDGNGRCARALFYWHLLSEEYWLMEYLSISRMFLQARSQYYRAFLCTEMDGGDLNYFIHYHVKMIVLAIDQVYNYIKQKQEKARETARNFLHSGLNPRQQDVLRYALKKPETRFTIYTHQVYQGVAYQTARTDLLDLVERGYLRQLKIGRAFYFEAVSDLIEKLKHYS